MTDVQANLKQAMSNLFAPRERSIFLAFVLSIILFITDLPFSGNPLSFDGIEFSKIKTNVPFKLILSAFTIFSIIFLIFFFLKKGQVSQDSYLNLFLFGEISIFFVLGLPFSTGAILHIILGYFIVINIEGKSNREQILKSLIFMYFIDFFLYPILSTYIVVLNGIRFAAHPYLVYTLFNGATYSENVILKTISVIGVIFLVIMLIANFGFNLYFINVMGSTDISELQSGKLLITTAGLFFINTWESISTGFQNFNQLFNSSQWTMTGQEQETENPQGVYLKEIKAGDYIYREGMPIYVSAILEARKIDKPFEVNVECYTEKINDIGKKEIVTGYINKKGQTKKNFKIINGAETTIQCSFDGDALPYGSYTIVINASFDFSTEATKKIYLMDRERMLNDYKLLNDKGIEPSKQAILELYKITDGDQPSIYTTGPISLAIGTENVPWEIGEENINPRFGIKIENKWQEGGKLSKLKNIYLKVPETFSILENTCTGIAVDSVAQTTEESEKSMKTYKIPVSDLLDISNIETFFNYICLMEISQNSLDKTPITTRYLKSKIEYQYELTRKININIEKKPNIEIEESLQNEI